MLKIAIGWLQAISSKVSRRALPPFWQKFVHKPRLKIRLDAFDGREDCLMIALQDLFESIHFDVECLTVGAQDDSSKSGHSGGGGVFDPLPLAVDPLLINLNRLNLFGGSDCDFQLTKALRWRAYP